MSKKLAIVEIHYRQNKSTSLDISKKVPQWIANHLAVRYLELLHIQEQHRKLKKVTKAKS